MLRIYTYLDRQSIQPPQERDAIIRRLFLSRIEDKPLVLFTPWGPRYKNPQSEILKADPEIATLQEMNTVLKNFRKNGYRLELLLMPADIYATEVNGLCEEFVQSYFTSLAQAAQECLMGITLRMLPWSTIRSENRQRYDCLRNETDANFAKAVNQNEYLRAVQTARNFPNDDRVKSARAYCIERIVEATIIEELFEPIKLSVVKKEKDVLDGTLPRIYMIKKRAPWLEGTR
jgi:hypothetical protein